jgi:hypothetical protein
MRPRCSLQKQQPFKEVLRAAYSPILARNVSKKAAGASTLRGAFSQ